MKIISIAYILQVHLLVKKDNTQGAGKGLYFLVKILMFRYSIVSIQLMKASTLRREGRGERQELGKRLFLVVGTGGLVGLR